jgi:glycosyltransferase involved in cell wall biosynthesis
MKILHVITSLQTGGAETLVVNLMPRFRALGHEVGVVVFNGEHTALMERLERECPQCKIFCLGTSYYNPWYIIKLIRIMRKYDVVHTHNSSPQLFAAIANVFCRKKLVTTEHSTNNRKREKGGWLRIIDRWMYARYDQVICISEIAEEKLRQYLAYPLPLPEGKGSLSPEGKGESVVCSDGKKTQNIKLKTQNSKLSIKRRGNICTINNGVDVEAIHQAQPVMELKTDKFVVVMVAGFREAKDQDTVIRAMAKLPKDQYELWFVGDGVRRQSVESLVLSFGLQDNVKFLGLRTDVPNILKTADVVVMSSHWEGLSLSNIEGMSAGKPFIASDVNGLREVTKGYGILFPHEDADALAEIIRKLHDTPDYYLQVAERCYERAKQFDIRMTVDAYNRVYKAII